MALSLLALSTLSCAGVQKRPSVAQLADIAELTCAVLALLPNSNPVRDALKVCKLWRDGMAPAEQVLDAAEQCHAILKQRASRLPKSECAPCVRFTPPASAPPGSQ